MTWYIICAIVAYAIGSISFSVIFSRKFAGFDVREKGSGNAGSTNVLRTVGKKAAIFTLICDALKGIIAILIATAMAHFAKDVDKALLVEIAGIAVILGHTFPIFFEFRGGKGVATSLGVLLTVNWQIGLICLVFALVIIILTRMVSAGSVLAAILFPILTLFIGKEYFIISGSYFVFSIIMALIVMFNHRSNIKRVLNGTENKMNFKK